MNKDFFPKPRVAIVVPAKHLFCLAGVLWTQRYGPLQVASITRQAGYFVRLFNEELGLRVSPQELAQEFDVVGFSSKTSAITRAEELAQAIKREAEKLGRHVVTVLGGEHISMGGDNRSFPFFDYMLRGESEEAFLVLLKALESEKHDATEIFQVYLKNRHTCESFNNIPDLSLVVNYDYTVQGFVFRYLPLIWTMKTKKLPMITFQGSRGCPYSCSFCPTPRHLQGNSYRRRSIESALQYLEEHLERSNIRRVMFEDPTAALPFDKVSHMFFETLAKNSTGMKATALVRADICEDGRLLELMKEAGVTNLSIGIESLSDQTRSDFKKKISYDTIRKSMDIFHEHGFTVTGLFIVGYDTDDLDTFQRIHDFISETGIEKWRISPLSQMPESVDQFMPAHRYFLWDEFNRFGREVADYCNGEFVTFYPKHMKPSTLQKKVMEFNLFPTSLTDIVRIFRKRGNLRSVLQRFGNHLAQRMVLKEITASKYIEMAQEVEREFYIECNGNEHLQEELLLRRYREKARTH
ncbi:MAG TPA: radical SAM protein [Syntrophales bacterium]|nr:radical SAM protein [Syntrophales bacterium]